MTQKDEITRDDLVAYIEDGAKPKEDWSCGTEYEKFAYRFSDLKPLDYNGAQGTSALLMEFRRQFDWTPILEDGHIVGLTSPEGQPKASITTEPAGQIELSGQICANVHDNFKELDIYQRKMAQAGAALDIGFLGIGYAPSWRLTDMSPMPKQRYAIIARYMARNSIIGLDMMYRSCTVQVNMDFSDEADMILKMRLGLAFQPLVSALFATSPFVDGKPNHYLTNRVNVWRYTDPARSGLLPFAFEDGFGYERYVDYALDIPIYFIIRGHRYLDAQQQTFRDFLNGKLEILPGERPTMADWHIHLATIYPEARLKKFIEMRGADSGWTKEHLAALPAIWTGILYDDSCCQAAWDLAKSWDADIREDMRREIVTKGLQGQVQGRKINDIARDFIAIAREGLNNRNIQNHEGVNESVYLEVLDDRVESGKTASERLLDLYHGAWNKDINQIFKVDETNLPD